MNIFKKSKTIEEAVSDSPSQKLHNLIVIDTSSLIDGRVAELADSGFIEATFVVADFVLDELQMLADGKDSMKRERARYGLDIVRRLKESRYCEVKLSRREYKDVPTVDSKLVALSLDINAKLCTNDYNLNKVADIQDVTVLNINELTKALRTTSLPGETQKITIVQKGSERKQGVGYLDDGTMIVVEDGQKYMKKEVVVEVEKMLQTEAGKMVFGKIIKAPKTSSSKTRPSRPKQSNAKRATKPQTQRKNTKQSRAKSSLRSQPKKQNKRAKPRRLNEKEKLENKLLDTIAKQ